MSRKRPEKWEPVFSVDNYYDGPRYGRSRLHGKACVYCALHWNRLAPTSEWNEQRDEGKFVLKIGAGATKTSRVARGVFRVTSSKEWVTRGPTKTLKVQWRTIRD